MIKISTYIISDLNLFNQEQKERMGYETFEQMNQYVVYSWNRAITETDSVIIMGKIGDGNVEQMKSIISQLNGILTLISREYNNNFSPEEIRNMGFKHVWNISLFRKIKENEKDELLCLIDPIKNIKDYTDYKLLLVDSNNSFEGMINDKMLSVEAIKWGYSPLNIEEIMTIYDNVKIFSELDVNEEKISDIKEEWEND